MQATHGPPLNMRALRPVAKQAWATFEHRSARHTSRKRTATAQAVEGNLGGLCVCCLNGEFS